MTLKGRGLTADPQNSSPGTCRSIDHAALLTFVARGPGHQEPFVAGSFQADHHQRSRIGTEGDRDDLSPSMATSGPARDRCCITLPRLRPPSHTGRQGLGVSGRKETG